MIGLALRHSKVAVMAIVKVSKMRKGKKPGGHREGVKCKWDPT